MTEPVVNQQAIEIEDDNSLEENGLADEVQKDNKCEDEIDLNVLDETEEEALDWEVDDESCLNDTSVGAALKTADDVDSSQDEVKLAADDSSVLKDVTVDADVDNREGKKIFIF